MLFRSPTPPHPTPPHPTPGGEHCALLRFLADELLDAELLRNCLTERIDTAGDRATQLRAEIAEERWAGRAAWPPSPACITCPCACLPGRLLVMGGRGGAAGGNPPREGGHR